MTKRDEVKVSLLLVAVGGAMVAGAFGWLYGIAWSVILVGVVLVSIGLLSIG